MPTGPFIYGPVPGPGVVMTPNDLFVRAMKAGAGPFPEASPTGATDTLDLFHHQVIAVGDASSKSVQTGPLNVSQGLVALVISSTVAPFNICVHYTQIGAVDSSLVRSRIADLKVPPVNVLATLFYPRDAFQQDFNNALNTIVGELGKPKQVLGVAGFAGRYDVAIPCKVANDGTYGM